MALGVEGLTSAIAEKLKVSRKRVFAVTVAVAVLVLGALTVRWNHAWRSASALAESDIAARPGTVRAHHKLALALDREFPDGSRIPDCLAACREAVRLKPDFLPAWISAGDLALRWEKACRANGLEDKAALARESAREAIGRAIELDERFFLSLIHI